MNITKKIEFRLFILSAVLALFCATARPATYVTVQSGDWENGSTWAGGSDAPTSGNNNVDYIGTGHSVVLNGNLEYDNNCALHVYGSLVINGDLIAWNSLIIEVSGSLIVNGNMSGKNGSEITISGMVDITGDVICDNNSTINLDDGTLDIGGTLTGGSGCEIIGTGTVNIEGPNNFDQTPAGGVDVNPSLPVELLEFTAKPDGENIKIFWSTASETNNDYFMLEKSPDAENWEVIGKVSGSGTVNTVTDYSFVDEDPWKGLNYYKLRQTDFNGAYEEFEIIAVNNNSDDDIIILPNSDNSGIALINNSGKEVLVNVYDLSGKEICKNKIPANSTLTEIDLKNSDGMYIVRVSSGTSEKLKKIILGQ